MPENTRQTGVAENISFHGSRQNEKMQRITIKQSQGGSKKKKNGLFL